MSRTEYQGTVSMIRKGPVGLYAIVNCDDPRVDGSVTFSLKSETWKEKDFPPLGSMVILSGLFKTTKGWRASHARLMEPGE